MRCKQGLQTYMHEEEEIPKFADDDLDDRLEELDLDD